MQPLCTINYCNKWLYISQHGPLYHLLMWRHCDCWGFGDCKEPLPVIPILPLLYAACGEVEAEKDRDGWHSSSQPGSLLFFLEFDSWADCYSKFSPQSNGGWMVRRNGRVYLVSHSVLIERKPWAVTVQMCSLYSGPHLLSWRALWECNLESQRSSRWEECEQKATWQEVNLLLHIQVVAVSEHLSYCSCPWSYWTAWAGLNSLL
jgi:hypothetical protein